MSLQVQPSSVSQFVLVNLRSATTGQLLTGIDNTEITVSYWRPGAVAPVAESSITAGTLGTYGAKTWIEYSTTGRYQYCPSNAAIAAGVPYVDLLFTATGAIDKVERIWLVNSVVPTTWYVRTTGADTNHGRSPDKALLTIGAAVTAASSGDTIDIGAGTFAEKVDIETAQKSLTIRGKNSTETIVSNSGTSSDTTGGADHCFVAWHGCTFERMRILQTATGTAAGQGIRAYEKTDIVVRDCYIESNYDCIYVAAVNNWTVQRCYLVCRYDCLNTEDSTAGLCEDCVMVTTCDANYSDSMRCIIMSGSVGVKIRRCYLAPTRTSSVAITNATYGIQGGQNYQVEDTHINVVNTDATNTANLGCIHGNNSTSEIILRGVTFTTSNAGSGTTRHLRNGKFTDLGSNVDTSLIHATNTTWTPLYTDTRKWLGTTAATPTTAGIPKVEAASGAGDATAANQTLILNQLQGKNRS